MSGGLHSNELNCDIRLELKFASALTANLTLVVVSEELAMLEIYKINHVVS